MSTASLSKGARVLRAVNLGVQTSLEISELTGIDRQYVKDRLLFWEGRGKIARVGQFKPARGRPMAVWRAAKGADAGRAALAELAGAGAQ